MINDSKKNDNIKKKIEGSSAKKVRKSSTKKADMIVSVGQSVTLEKKPSEVRSSKQKKTLVTKSEENKSLDLIKSAKQMTVQKRTKKSQSIAKSESKSVEQSSAVLINQENSKEILSNTKPNIVRATLAKTNSEPKPWPFPMSSSRV